MIISSGRSYVFVHAPKTGGTSLAYALETRARGDDILIGDTPKAKKRRHRLNGAVAAGRVWKHSSLADVEGIISLDDIRASFCFTMVRNPWDRMVSYYQWLQTQRFEHVAVGLAKQLNFAEFLRAPQIVSAFQSGPYSSYMTCSDGVDQADLYIRLEHFDQDAEPLWSHLGFVLDLPHLNQSNRKKDYRSYFSDSDAECLARMCSKDIEQFSYTF